MSDGPIGFIGLGNMGGPMAANLAEAGWPLIVYDAAGTRERAPAGADVADSLAEVAAAATVVLLSLPDAPVVDAVADGILATSSVATRRVVDTSTIGIAEARRIHAKLAAAAIDLLLSDRSQDRCRAALASERDAWRWSAVARPLVEVLPDLPKVTRGGLVPAVLSAGTVLAGRLPEEIS